MTMRHPDHRIYLAELNEQPDAVIRTLYESAFPKLAAENNA